jgi:O-antigen biosynthesis protein
VPSTKHQVASYWDENREISKDPTYWMAHPVCRAAINRRVSGNEQERSLDWFRRVHAPVPFRRGVSWGCGLGAFERSAIRSGLAKEMEAFDISEASLEDARRVAREEGVEGIRYLKGDFNNPEFEPGRYDLVCFHASLHHVRSLGGLFRYLVRRLPAGTAVYVEEYVGPSADTWRLPLVAAAQRLLNEAPWDAKVRSLIDPPVNVYDPSEATRSGEIRSFLRSYLDIVEWKPYGGQLAGLVFPYLKGEWTSTEAGTDFARKLMELEDREIAEDPESSHHLVAFGRLKSLTSAIRAHLRAKHVAARAQLLAARTARRFRDRMAPLGRYLKPSR